MKYHLFLGTATCVLLGVSGQVGAQSSNNPSYSKGEARIFDDTRRIEAPRRQASRDERYEEQVSRIEPAAGNSSPFSDFTGIYGGGDIGYSFTEDVEGFGGGVFLGYGFEHNFRGCRR